MRPLVTVQLSEDTSKKTIKFPQVFQAPIRPDLVNKVLDHIRRNKRQPYAVSPLAGVQCSAESWGTGRAVARVPRVKSSGTHRSGQGAYANFCRGGHMSCPTSVLRRWNRKTNLTQRRFAITSAVAASCLVPLVTARGHKISKINEIPLVVSDKAISAVEGRTSNAKSLLVKLGVGEDLDRSVNSKRIRPGKGKARNRKYKLKRGPLVIVSDDQKRNVYRAFTNLPGVDICCVERLSLHKLCPGGHLGRLIVWSSSAFEKLAIIYGTRNKPSSSKKNFIIPRPIMKSTDVSRIVNSDEVKIKLRQLKPFPVRSVTRSNPLKNSRVMHKLNPYAAVSRRKAYNFNTKRHSAKLLKKKQPRKMEKKFQKPGKPQKNKAKKSFTKLQA